MGDDLRGVVDGLAEEFHVHVRIGVGDRPLDRADPCDIVMLTDFLHVLDVRDEPLADFVELGGIRHVFFKLPEVGEGALRYPGGSSLLVDLPVVAVHAEKADPIVDLGAHPVVDRIVGVAGHVEPDGAEGPHVQLHHLLETVFPRGIIPPVTHQEFLVVDKVVGQHAVDGLSLEDARKAFQVLHVPSRVQFLRSWSK